MLSSGQAAKAAGVGVETLRFYERKGLLPKPTRRTSGYRVYTHDSVERLAFIKRAQRFGLKLEAIAELLDVRERGLCPCGHTRRMLEERVAELDEEMSSLARLRADIATMIGELPEPAGGNWRCSSDLMQIGPSNPFRDRSTEEEKP